MIQKPLGKRKCKHCAVLFQKSTPLQMYCTPQCGYDRAKKMRQEQLKKAEKKELKEMKIEVYGKENRKYLQDEINKLARKIDAACGVATCIDCNRPFGKQTDAAHYHSRGGNCSLRYNLHNLHSANSYCNQHSPDHKKGYETGLQVKYGIEYMDLVVNELPLKYIRLDLNNKVAYEKLALVRKINRTFHTYQITDPVSAREMFNKLIGIY